MARTFSQEEGVVHTWYVLAVLEGAGYSYLSNEEGESLEFTTLEEALEALRDQDCPEGIVILRETREILPGLTDRSGDQT